MTNQHGLFNFINKVSPDLYELVTQLEDALFKQPQTVLIQARLYTEQLVKLVSKEEGLEDVYPIKHSERIFKLYRQNSIEEEIYVKIEWIRKKGNKAAHDVSSVSYEDGFKAHKYMFDISVWYMQLYINYDFEAPIYKLPIKNKDENVIPAGELNEAMKPFLDQSFKQMDEMRKEIQRELEELKKVKNRAVINNEAQQEPAGSSDEGTHFPLLGYLEDQQITYIDKRDLNGALWVIGGWELNEKLLPLKEHKIYFRYSKRGSRSTKHEPAWFLLNKNLTESHTPASSNEQAKQDDEKVGHSEKSLKKKFAVTLEIAAMDYWRRDGQLLVPYFLLDRKLDELSLEGIQRLRNHLEIKTLGDLTETNLRDLYKLSREDFHFTVQTLFGLGCRFVDRLSSFQPVSTSDTEFRFNIEGDGQEDLHALLPLHIAKTFSKKGFYQLKDLHNCLSESVKLLTKVDAKDLLNLLSQPAHNIVPNNNEKDTTSIKDKSDSNQSIVLSFQGEQLEIREDLSERQIKELGITGCDNMIQQLHQMNMNTLKDFGSTLDGLYLRLESVGVKTVKKFWTQLINLNDKALVASSSTTDSEGNKLVYLADKKVVIPISLLNLNLNIEDFPGAEKAIESMLNHGIKTMRDLPGKFEELKQLDGVGKTKLIKIFDRLQSLIELSEEQYQLEQLPPGERLSKEVVLFEKWIGRLQEDENFLKTEKISLRYFRLMRRRFEASLKGQHLTLEALGEEDGVTRERIRQILSKGDKRVAARLTKVQNLLQEILILSNHLMLVSFIDISNFSHFIFKTALEDAGLTFVSLNDHLLLSDLKKEKIEEYQMVIKEEVEKTFLLHVITPKDFQEYCKEKAEDDGMDINIVRMFASPYIKWLSSEQGVLHNLKKFQAVEMVMLQYPEGVEVYKREDELNLKANDLMPGEFKNVRDFYAIATRSDLADRIFLWDRGMYIHSAFATKDEEWVQQVQETAETWLKEKEDFIHVAKLYEAVKDEALERKVPSEYALYTLMRHYSLGSLALTRFPIIQFAGTERQANADYIERFIRENGGYASFQELFEVFVEQRGWKRFSLEFALSSKEQFIQYRHGHWSLLSNYQDIQLEDIPFIVKSIQEKVDNVPFFSINSIFMEHEVVLKSMGIETKQILHAILKNRGGLPVKFLRYPYIVKADYEFDTFSGIRYIEQFILEQNDIVAREEVEAWVEEVFGQNDRILDIALIQTPNILYYTKGQFGEYIHRKNIGIHIERETLIHEALYQRFNAVTQSKNRVYSLLSELYDPSYLPSLEEGYYWSQDLLGDILKKSGKWTVIGSYDEILVPTDNEITDDVSFLGYVLSHHFNGSAKLKDFQSFLINIRYSSRGNLLYAVEDALSSGKAPYVIDGDEIMLAQLSKGEVK